MTDDILDQLEDEIDALCSDLSDPACDTLESAVEEMKRDVNPITSLNEFKSGGHSYRGYSPRDVERLIVGVGTERGEKGTEVTAADGINFIEAGRWSDFLESASKMFNRLDDDERKMFAERNPDLVEWVTVYDEANGYDPMLRWRALARSNLTGGDDGRREAADPPPFLLAGGSSRGESFQSFYTRRRSYRNWTPQEFERLLDQEEMGVTAGQAREIGLRTTEIRDEIDFPTDFTTKEIVRELLERIEAGRFLPMLADGMTFFSPLDPDERRMFSRRNPGVMMWISVYGESNHLIHREQLGAHTYPTLPEG